MVWALWHLPGFVLLGFPQSGGPFPLFTAALVTQSDLMTRIYRATGGSVLLAGILFHLVVNATIILEVGAYPIWVALLSAAAVATTGPKRLQRRPA